METKEQEGVFVTPQEELTEKVYDHLFGRPKMQLITQEVLESIFN